MWLAISFIWAWQARPASFLVLQLVKCLKWVYILWSLELGPLFRCLQGRFLISFGCFLPGGTESHPECAQAPAWLRATGSEVGMEMLGETWGSSPGRRGQCAGPPPQCHGVGNSCWYDSMKVRKVWGNRIPKCTCKGICPKAGHAKEETNNNEVCLGDGHQLD